MPAGAQHKQLVWYGRWVTLGLTVVCNGLIVGGWWLSGVNLDTALSPPEIYDSRRDYCVRVEWKKIVDVVSLQKVCTEWLDVTDPTGTVHRLREGQALVVGADSQLHYEGEQDEGLRLFGLALFVVAVIVGGMWVKYYLMTSYTRKLGLDAASNKTSSHGLT